MKASLKEHQDPDPSTISHPTKPINEQIKGPDEDDKLTNTPVGIKTLNNLAIDEYPPLQIFPFAPPITSPATFPANSSADMRFTPSLSLPNARSMICFSAV